MTCLLRARGSTSEMARLVSAEPEPGLDWPESIWTGESVPVVVQDDGRRRLTTMTWGLPVHALARKVPSRQRSAVYPRDFWRNGSRLNDAAALSRCLILLESFAYPSGQAGRCTRSWIGLWDHPLVAWAGVYTEHGCAGLLVAANGRVEPLSQTMPRLLMPEDHVCWLEGGSLLSLGAPYPDDAFYRENLAERWSTGRSGGQELPLLAAAG